MIGPSESYSPPVTETEGVSREEHLAMVRKVALAFIAKDDPVSAFACMIIGARAHPETINHIGIHLGVVTILTGGFDSRKQMEDWINCFQ